MGSGGRGWGEAEADKEREKKNNAGSNRTAAESIAVTLPSLLRSPFHALCGVWRHRSLRPAAAAFFFFFF